MAGGLPLWFHFSNELYILSKKVEHFHSSKAKRSCTVTDFTTHIKEYA